MNARIGFVGLGLMGSAMARRFLASGCRLVMHNRTRERVGPLLELGALRADSPREVARHSDCVFSVLSTSDVFRQTSTVDSGILSGLVDGGIHVDCSTVSPVVIAAFTNLYESEGRFLVHCPVLGRVFQGDGRIVASLRWRECGGDCAH